MTSYTAIANGDIDQDSPVTQPLVTALRDNPIAITEGSTGAPKVTGNALDVKMADIALSGTTWVGLTNLDRKTWFRFDIDFDGTVAGDFQVRFSDDNGANWGTTRTIGALAAQNSTETAYYGFGVLWINIVTGAYRYGGLGSRNNTIGAMDRYTLSGTVTALSNPNGVQFRWATSTGMTGNMVGMSLGGEA